MKGYISVHFFKFLFDLEKKGNLDKVRISSDVKMGFPVNSSVCEFDDRLIKLKATFSGLYGVSSVLPPFLNEMALENSESGDIFRAFLDIFQQRLYLLKFEIWKQSYAPFFVRDFQSAYSKLLKSISGNKISGVLDSSAYPIAGLLSKRAVSKVRLIKIIEFLTGFSVEIDENVERWVNFKQKSIHYRLGEKALLGDRYLENRRLFLIKINCVTTQNLQKIYFDSIFLKQLKKILMSCLSSIAQYQIWLQSDQEFLQTCLGSTKTRLGLGTLLAGSSKRHCMIRLNDSTNDSDS